jgi:type IV fimbrial biogenesis protein FimT
MSQRNDGMKNTLQPNRGFTLIDLLIVLSIVAILSALTLSAFPVIEKYQVERNAKSVIQAVMYGRSLAISEGKSIFICPSNDGQVCDKDWSSTMLVYRNQDNDLNYGPQDELVYRFELTSQSSRVRWGSFRRKDYLELLPTGMTNFQNGTFTVCSKSKNTSTAIPVIINVAGRPYFGTDKNKDGVREYSSGKPVSCS